MGKAFIIGVVSLALYSCIASMDCQIDLMSYKIADMNARIDKMEEEKNRVLSGKSTVESVIYGLRDLEVANEN